MRNLEVEDVKGLIQQVRSGAADLVGGVRQALQGLGDDVCVTGDVLGSALEQSGIAVPRDAAEILGAVQSIAKTEDQVTVQLGSETKVTVRGSTPLRLGPVITFVLENFPDGVALGNIAGVAVHKFMWIDIQRVQFREAAGRRTVRVDTSFGGKEFVLA